MKTIKQIQEENRKLIILANFKEDDKGFSKFKEIKLVIKSHPNFSGISNSQIDLLASDLDLSFNTIEITLGRVLMALEPYPNNWGLVAGHIAKINRKEFTYDFKCKWDLTKPTLDHQTQQTQIEINKLLTE